MKQKVFLALTASLLSVNLIFGQFIIKSTYMETTGLSNQGLVAGYVSQAGPYSIWNPDSATTIVIGGLAPGQGIGGQARFSDDGNFLCGTSMGTNGAEMSRYNVSANQWDTVGCLGFVIDSTVSGGYAMSGDGNTVAGNSWADTTGGFAFTHAVAWNATEGLMDLGSLFDSIGRSTRVDAISGDGSVAVGWQDFNGPWKSAVWRKNPDGGYFPNTYILIDTLGSDSDDYNQMGECSVVSADGKWIGGYGDYANNYEPWIWSQATGIINLGTLFDGATGNVTGINADGSKVVGWFDTGFGAPQIPFIWTQAGGLLNLNTYIDSALGFSMGANQVYTATCMSSNGKYIAGYGIDTTTFNYFAYRVSAAPATGINSVAQSAQAKLFPNPASSQLKLLLPQNTSSAQLIITDEMGRQIHHEIFSGINSEIDVSQWSRGVYFYYIKCDGEMMTGKLVVQ